MLGLSRKSYTLLAPISGKTIRLCLVPDNVFAHGLAGNGVAIEPTGDIVTAPADGILTLLFRTNHAFGIALDNGVEVLVHIGLDTIELEGQGFESIAKQGDRVKTGDPIVKINRKVIVSSGRSLITPVLITNTGIVKRIKPFINIEVTAGIDKVIEYTLA